MMAVFGFFDASRFDQYRGSGFLAGLAPTSGNPQDPASVDGRFRILNVPTRGRIVVLDQASLAPVVSVRSNADGTFRVDYLDTARDFVVLGFDDRAGGQNVAGQDRVRPVPMV